MSQLQKSSLPEYSNHHCNEQRPGSEEPGRDGHTGGYPHSGCCTEAEEEGTVGCAVKRKKPGLSGRGRTISEGVSGVPIDCSRMGRQDNIAYFFVPRLRKCKGIIPQKRRILQIGSLVFLKFSVYTKQEKHGILMIRGTIPDIRILTRVPNYEQQKFPKSSIIQGGHYHGCISQSLCRQCKPQDVQR